jgi:hypothetical protein
VFALLAIRVGPDAAHDLTNDPYRPVMPAHFPLADRDTPSTGIADALAAVAA